MTIAILPMLIEALPMVTGMAGVVAVSAFLYFRHKKSTAETDYQNNDQAQANANTPPPFKPDSAESAFSPIAKTIVEEVSEIIELITPNESSPTVIAEETETVDEEPMLKRHHLNNIRLMLVATTFPHPTDSALSRHYDEMIDAKAEECLENEAKMARLLADYEAIQNAQSTAEDSATASESEEISANEEPMLKRHHLNNIRLMLVATTFPHPTDSVLSRHYDEMIDAKAEDCLENEAKMARLLADYEACQRVEIAKEKSADAPSVAVASLAVHKSAALPEDSTLRRHYLSALRAEIEKNKAPRPTDSTLRRHHDAMIAAEMERHLACH